MMPITMAPMRILIVDDEAPLRRMLRLGLGANDHDVVETDRGAAALEAVRRKEVDLLLLDLGLPDIDGLQVIRRIRYAQSNVLIIVLSNRGDEEAKVGALDLGADDYLTKPFSIEELLARIRVLQRQRIQRPADRSVIELGDLRLNMGARSATVRGSDTVVRFSPREYDLLQLLTTHAGKVLTHRLILRQVWGNETDVQYLRIYIRSLRQKIERDPEHPTMIVTVQGVGYCLRVSGQTVPADPSARLDAGSGAAIPAVNLYPEPRTLVW
jgi:two-component system, OmpR family, KDP operon response regulator KdpE